MPETLFSIDNLLEQMVARNASDLHITVGSKPALRVRGHLERLEEAPELSPEDTQTLLYRILSTEQQKHLEINRQIDVAYSIPGLARFRVNVYFQRNALGAAFRLIPHELRSLEEIVDSVRVTACGGVHRVHGSLRTLPSAAALGH